MAMEIARSYGSYAANSAAAASKTEQAAEKMGGKSEGLNDYLDGLKSLAPSVDVSMGSGVSTAKSGITLTISSAILAKMQSDPAQEKETKELIQGMEKAVNIIKGVCRATGWEVVYKHSFIDENGKYRSIGFYRNVAGEKRTEEFRAHVKEQSDKLKENMKARAEAHEENLKEIIEKRQDAAEEAEKKGAGPDKIEEKDGTRKNKETAFAKVRKILEEKMENSQDGKVYLYATDLKRIIAAAEEDGGRDETRAAAVGENFDLQI